MRASSASGTVLAVAVDGEVSKESPSLRGARGLESRRRHAIDVGETGEALGFLWVTEGGKAGVSERL